MHYCIWIDLCSYTCARVSPQQPGWLGLGHSGNEN